MPPPSSAPVPSSSAPPLRVAHCVVGHANHTRPRSVPLWLAGGYGPLLELINGIQSSKVHSDVFLHVDLANYPPKGRGQEDAPVAAEEALSYVSVETLRPALDALKPVAITYANASAAHCSSGRDCDCRLSWPSALRKRVVKTWPRWWEQARKSAECFAMVHRHEVLHGFQYDWVSKIRADLPRQREVLVGNAPGSAAAEELVRKPRQGNVSWVQHVTARAILDAMGRCSDRRCGETSRADVIYVHPWLNGPCYGQLDWMMISPREIAPSYFGVTGATCAWREQLHSRYVDSPIGGCLKNERLLAEWLLHSGARFEALPTPGEPQLPTITPDHPWHQPGNMTNATASRLERTTRRARARRTRLRASEDPIDAFERAEQQADERSAVAKRATVQRERSVRVQRDRD